jgi:HSP20 family protein
MTTLMRYKPKNGMISLFDNMFNDDFFNFDLNPVNSGSIDYDIIENEKDYVLDLMLPGFNKEDVSVSVEDNIMTIEGERKFDEKTKYNRKGSFYGRFKKSFTLPDEVLADQISASHNKNGILSITIPKDEKAKLSKVIEIK